MVYSWQIFTYDLKVFGKDWRYIQRAIVPNHTNHSPPTKLLPPEDCLKMAIWKKSRSINLRCEAKLYVAEFLPSDFYKDIFEWLLRRLENYKSVYIISKVFVGHSIPTAAASEAWWLVHVVESVWIKNLFVITHKYVLSIRFFSSLDQEALVGGYTLHSDLFLLPWAEKLFVVLH